MMEILILLKKKVVVSKDDIKELYDMFTSLPLETQDAEKPKGGMITGFRFNLTDGTSYALIHIGYGFKNGTLKSSTGNFEYFTNADINSYWSNIDIEAVSVEEIEVPK